MGYVGMVFEWSISGPFGGGTGFWPVCHLLSPTILRIFRTPTILSSLVDYITITTLDQSQIIVDLYTHCMFLCAEFAHDQFNFQNPQLGNLVKLVSSSRQYECDIHKDGSNEYQIMCYTRCFVSICQIIMICDGITFFFEIALINLS